MTPRTLTAGALAAAALALTAAPAGAAAPPGPIFGWGSNNYGQIGTGNGGSGIVVTTPTPANGADRAVQVVAGPNQAITIQANGTVAGWGNNHLGQLADGTVKSTWEYTPPQAITVANITTAQRIATAGSTSLAALADGTVRAWGTVSSGTLGDTAGTTLATLPVTVDGVTNAIDVAVGESHRLIARADGTVLAWGSNSRGQVGNGTTTTTAMPVQVSDIGVTTPKAVQVVAGVNFSAALLADGTVRVWGNNSAGAFGVTSTALAFSSTPVVVPGVSGVVEIAAGYGHLVARLADGTVMTWGENIRGQLGDGTTTSNPTPRAVAGLTDVATVAAGNRHSAAIKRDGTVWTWGYNNQGELGDGTRTNRSTPVQVPNLRAVDIDIAGPGNGDAHAVAIAALPATVGPAEVAFGTQAQGTIGAAKTVTVTAGSLALPIKRVTLGDGDVDQFLIGREDCVGETLAPGDSCTIAVRYAPSAAGDHAASVDVVTTNGVPVPQGTVTGTGGDLVVGPKGEDGTNGTDGTDGTAGTPGATGPAGPTGATGATGAKGDTGAKGADAKPFTVACTLNKKKTKVSCKVKTKSSKRVSTTARFAGTTHTATGGRTVTLTARGHLRTGTKVALVVRTPTGAQALTVRAR
jgi:alpha-tubulin suppressor-like RCC1 family protein